MTKLQQEKKAKPDHYDRLRELIYNPEPPQGWQELPDSKKVVMFRHLFMMLNEEFQRECGEELAEWVTIFDVLRSMNAKERATFKHDWIIRNSDGRYLKCEECTKNGEIECRMKARPPELYDILIRNWQGPARVEDDGRLIIRDFLSDHAVEEVGIGISFGGGIPAAIIDKTVSDYRSYLRERHRGNVPRDLFPRVKIHRPKEKLMEEFEEFVDLMQAEYFFRHPEDIKPEYGHVARKADDRKQPYPFDELERYYRVHVLRERGDGRDKMKYKEIAQIVFPKEDMDSSFSKISQDIRKAKKLIENAWSGKFPGQYS